MSCTEHLALELQEGAELVGLATEEYLTVTHSASISSPGGDGSTKFNKECFVDFDGSLAWNCT